VAGRGRGLLQHLEVAAVAGGELVGDLLLAQARRIEDRRRKDPASSVLPPRKKPSTTGCLAISSAKRRS
jgi:hypothetical protein